MKSIKELKEEAEVKAQAIVLILVAFFLGLFCLLFFLPEADAQSPRIRVVALTAKDGFNCYETREYYKMAAYIIESQSGIRLRHRFRCAESENPSFIGLSQQFYALDRRYKRRRMPVKVITGAAVDDKNNLYTGGLAYIGMRRGLGWSFVTPANQNGEDRANWALITIAHELAHVLGARHDNSNGSIMDINSLGQLSRNPNQTLGFTQESIRQMRREIRWWRRGIMLRQNQAVSRCHKQFAS